MERKVRPGEFYRHMTGKCYQIVAVARHSETGERMVVYQALYGDFAVYVRPYDMFVSEVDREKYPEATQRYRFEQIWPQGADEGTDETRQEPGKACLSDPEPARPNPDFLRFLDADGYEEQAACLKRLARTATQKEMDSVFLVLDMKPERGPIEDQARAAIRFLETQHRYDGKRLR
ncbi:MAG: DUF1653 domain-containing protein [Clostridiales bacterium]|nr:DUF1653 domain-containing protein [Clostridiales bacterium]